MRTYRGQLTRIGPWRGGMLVEEDRRTGRQAAKARIRGEIDGLTIGGVTLKRPACTEGLFPRLEAGREVSLYVYRHLFHKDYIIGVKYADDGARHVMPDNEVRGTILQYVFVWPLLLGIAGLIVGSIVGLVLRFMGDVLPPLFMLGGVGLAWWSAYRFRQDLALARAD